ncbi:MAG TPA: hypothetical protein VFO58_15050 [Vicinamibacterales bacterium]|nr:hypothetical protein [Vicinamibacterales bacterium]
MIGPLADHLWQSTLFAAGVALRALVFRRNRRWIPPPGWFPVSLPPHGASVRRGDPGFARFARRDRYEDEQRERKSPLGAA